MKSRGRVNSAVRRISYSQSLFGGHTAGGKPMTKSLSVFLSLVAVCLMPVWAEAQRPSPKIGDAAPAFTLDKVLQANGNGAVGLNELKDNVVVLEFWATWCSPCIRAIQHYNELSEKFKGRPVRFIAITDEDEMKIAQFIKTKPIRTWIGFDKTHATSDAYQVVGLPHTVIIDRNGRIAAITLPENVTEAVLNDLIDGKSVSLPLKSTIPADLDWDKAATSDQIEPIMQVIIKPSNAVTGGMKNWLPVQGHITADGAVLMNLICAAYQVSSFRVINNLPASRQPYRVSVIVPPGREEALYPLFQQALATTFGINVRREMRETDVIILTVPQGKAGRLQPSQAKEVGIAMFMRGQIRAQKYRIKTLVEQLENILGRPVVDKTGLTGEYDWELPYSKVDKNVLINAVREKLGIEIAETRQPIEMFIVEKTSPNK